ARRLLQHLRRARPAGPHRDSRERVGFYNTFAARALQDRIEIPEVGPIEISRDRETGEVHALRGPRFASMQFHPESVLTREGPRIIADLLRHALVERRP
ncbi:glutamine amidotransferase-related protein, partial [Pseudomonas aeruginosa]|uniref:glutamine amidotransferase-related protein n=1 Tax=Pseudomonas aeruginosa TaxID=287 RepID=UPI0039FBD9D1